MAYDDIQDQIDEGRQMAADELGPPHNVYRLINADVNGKTLIPGNLIASGISIYTKIAYGADLRESLETERQQGILWEKLIADMSPFQVGDVMINIDPVYGAGASRVAYQTLQYKGFALADRSPGKKSLGAWINRNVRIYRKSTVPTDSDEWDKIHTSDLPLILNAGVWSWGTAGQVASLVPSGLMSSGKSYGNPQWDELPASQRKSGWELYMPPLQGYEVEPNDVIITEDGIRFNVIVPFILESGASGNQLFLEREVSGAS